MHRQTPPGHRVMWKPKSGSARGRSIRPHWGHWGTGTRRLCSPTLWRQAVSALRSYRVEPKPGHCPECGRDLTFLMESERLNRLNARGNFSLSSALCIWNHFSYMREIGQMLWSYRLWKNSLFQLCERGPQTAGRIPLAQVPFPIGLSCLSKERSREGRRRDWAWLKRAAVATVLQCNITMAIIICKKNPWIYSTVTNI